MCLILLISMILGALTLLGPLITQIMVDSIIIAKSNSLLTAVLVAMVAAVVVSSGVGLLNTYLSAVFIQRLSFDIKYGLYRHLSQGMIRAYSKKRVGDLLYILFNDGQVVCSSVGGLPITVILSSCTAAFIIFWMLHLNVQLTMFVTGVVALHCALIYGFRRPIETITRKQRALEEDIYGTAKEALDGIELVQSCGSLGRELRSFHSKLHQSLKISIRGSLLSGLSGVLVSVASSVWLFGTLWYGGRSVIRGDLTIGELMAFLALCRLLLPAASTIANIAINYPASIISLRRFYEVVDQLPTTCAVASATPICIEAGEISFRNVSFAYAGQARCALKDITLDIHPNESVALVGRSGSGKTTMVNLIAGFIAPTRGAVWIDGNDSSKVLPQSLWTGIGFVMQNLNVFSGTVAENIMYGNKNVSFDQVVEAAKSAYVHEQIVRLRHGYETEIGKWGLRISSGEAQRIALARVFLRNPRILILDEATSCLDNQTEYLIQKALRRLSHNRTTIAITHRLTTARSSDRILVIDEGSIAESGSHEDLIKRRGLYYKLWKHVLVG